MDTTISNSIWLQDFKEIGLQFETQYGKILLNKQFRGKIFIDGLGIVEDTRLGYDSKIPKNLIKESQEYKTFVEGGQD